MQRESTDWREGEFKIQREREEKRGGRLTKVRWCMRNGVQNGRFISEMEGDDGRKRVKQSIGSWRWWRRREGRGS